MLDSASDILNRLSSGQSTAAEVTRQALDAIDASQSRHNAFTFVAHEAAMATAERVDAKRAAGEPLGPLAGVPVAVKDVLCTDDMPTTCSSQMLKGFRAPYSATVVQKLIDADAIIVGKTNMDEFAMGASTENSIFGVTRNPWNTDCTPGGSSGGSAAAVAAGTGSTELGHRYGRLDPGNLPRFVGSPV